jgi:hypothetical protein
MAIARAYHFDNGIIPPSWAISNNTYTGVSTTYARTGSYSLKMTAANSTDAYTAVFMVDNAVSEFYLQFGFRFSTGLSTNISNLVRWFDSPGNVLGGVRFLASDFRFHFYTDNFVNEIGTSAQVFSTDTWYVIELHIVIADSGTFEMRVNGLSDSNYSCDTKPGTASTIKGFRWGNLYGTSAYYLDDIIVNDTSGSFNNSWPNCAKVFFCLPSSDVGTNQWSPTPAGLTHYTTLNEVPVSTSEFIRAATTNLVEIFELSDVPALAGSIKAVIPEAYCYKGSSDVPSRLDLGVDVGGSVQYSSDLDVGINYGIVRNVFNERPGGGSFTASDVNSMKLLIKSAP